MVRSSTKRQAALVHVNQNLAHLSLNLPVHQQDFIGGIVVPNVVRNLLEVPAQLAGVGIQRDHAGGVEIHVLGLVGSRGYPIGIVEIRCGVAGSPVDQVEFGIERAGEPGRSAPVAPTVSLPGFIALFTRSGHDVPAPGDTTSLRVERGEIAAMRLIATVATHDDLVLDNERRGEVIAATLLGIVDADFPHLFAGFLIERDHEVIPGTEDDFAVADRDPAVLDEIGVTTGNPWTGGRIAVLPDQFPLAASSAKTRALAEMRYITPLTTMGVEPRYSV